jgi:lambda family phage minor tail protein L
MSALTERQQTVSPGTKVELYKLDLTVIGVNSVYYSSPFIGAGGALVSFGGQAYQHFAIGIKDIERRAGENPEPRLTIGNTNKFVAGLVYSYGDLVGAEITRTVTLGAFLDGQPTADSTAILTTDIFVIEQKLNINHLFAQFALRVLADMGNRKVPRRTCMRDQCQWKYRTWDAATGTFKYPVVRPCPYNGSSYFDKNGVATTAPNDACSRDLAGCKKRYGDTAELPFGGFPGMSKIRIS